MYQTYNIFILPIQKSSLFDRPISSELNNECSLYIVCHPLRGLSSRSANFRWTNVFGVVITGIQHNIIVLHLVVIVDRRVEKVMEVE